MFMSLDKPDFVYFVVCILLCGVLSVMCVVSAVSVMCVVSAVSVHSKARQSKAAQS